MRVAFASIDNNSVDQHFGSARYWQIYDIDQRSTYVELRKVTVPNLDQAQHEDKFQQIYEILQDCAAIFVLQIGDAAARFLSLRDIRVFEASGEITLIIKELIEKNLLGNLEKEN